MRLEAETEQGHGTEKQDDVGADRLFHHGFRCWRSGHRAGQMLLRPVHGTDGDDQGDRGQRKGQVRIDAAQAHRQVGRSGAGDAHTEQGQRRQPRQLGRRNIFAQQRHGWRAQGRGGHGPDGDQRQEQQRRARRRGQRQQQEGRAGHRRDDYQQPTETTQNALHAVGGNAQREIHQGEDDLVGHQDVDHPFLFDAGLHRELRQEDDIHRPATDKQELYRGEINADARHSRLRRLVFFVQAAAARNRRFGFGSSGRSPINEARVAPAMREKTR